MSNGGAQILTKACSTVIGAQSKKGWDLGSNQLGAQL